MRVQARIAKLERQLGDLKVNCPFCRQRPAEGWVSYVGQKLPPSEEPPCEFCGKRPLRIQMMTPHLGAYEPAWMPPMPYRYSER